MAHAKAFICVPLLHTFTACVRAGVGSLAIAHLQRIRPAGAQRHGHRCAPTAAAAHTHPWQCRRNLIVDGRCVSHWYAVQVPPGQIGLGRNQGRRLRYDAHAPLPHASPQIKSPPLWSALLRKSAMHSRAEHLFPKPAAPGLLHVPWHMQKLSFACHYYTR